MKLNKGDIVTLDIDKLVFEGKGISELSAELNPGFEEPAGMKIFVPFAYPGDRVLARVFKVKKNYADADITELIRASEHRVEPRCAFYKSCGGCKQQDLAYNTQAEMKLRQVEEIFRHTGGYEHLPILPIIPADETFYYRNKMEFSFAETEWITQEKFVKGEEVKRSPALGLHVPQGFERVLNIDRCFLQSELSNRILRFTASYFFSSGVSVYGTKTHTGYLRNLVIRESKHTGEVMVNLVTSERDEKKSAAYTKALISEIPEITTVVNNVNTRKSLTAQGEYEFADFGPGYITDMIGGMKFRISANSFFQTNTLQAKKLYDTAAASAGFSGDETVYDMFCGTGTISLYISGMVKRVYGFELSGQAVADAAVNSGLNGNGNCEFYEFDLYASLLPLLKEKNIPLPDAVIVDPPRNGLHKNTVRDLIELSPPKIIYVSCNPATQLRDIQMLAEGGYTPVSLQPVDMFPHTFHIETVCLLIKQ